MEISEASEMALVVLVRAEDATASAELSRRCQDVLEPLARRLLDADVAAHTFARRVASETIEQVRRGLDPTGDVLGYARSRAWFAAEREGLITASTIHDRASEASTSAKDPTAAARLHASFGRERAVSRGGATNGGAISDAESERPVPRRRLGALAA